MAFLECGYAGRDKEVIRLCADLGPGWRRLDKVWGFDAEDFLEYGESKFRCRLRLVEKAPSSFESRKTFHERFLDPPRDLGDCRVSLHGWKLEVDVPMAQAWFPTNDSNRRPMIYEIGEDIFSINTSEGVIPYRLQIWVVLHGPSRMFVKDQHERGDGFAWVGGRPESNRRKF
jgi:hypothetical protein